MKRFKIGDEAHDGIVREISYSHNGERIYRISALAYRHGRWFGESELHEMEFSHTRY